MPKITEQRLDEIRGVLEKSFLTGAGYEVFTNEPNDALVRINVRDYEQFSIRLDRVEELNLLEAQFNEPGKVYFTSTESPGDYMEEQSNKFSEFSEFSRRLALWCDRVKTTLIRNDSVQRQLSEIRERFEKEFVEFVAHAQDSNAHFTPEEKQGLFATLDNLESKLREMISNDAAKAEKIEKLESMINEMKEATALPKKAAYRVIGSKLAMFMVSSAGAALIADGLNSVIGLLTAH